MRQYTWDEYYEKFYDWAESTQVRNLTAFTSLGTADEVGEIISELQVNVPAANRLLRKAVEAKLAFSASDLIEFLCINDKTLSTAALYNSADRLTSSDMEDLYGVAEDDDIIKICRDRNLTLPEDLRLPTTMPSTTLSSCAKLPHSVNACSIHSATENANA